MPWWHFHRRLSLSTHLDLRVELSCRGDTFIVDSQCRLISSFVSRLAAVAPSSLPQAVLCGTHCLCVSLVTLFASLLDLVELAAPPARNITCSCGHHEELHAVVLCSCQTSEVRLVPEFRLLLMGLLEITCPSSSTATKDRLLFLCTKPDTSRLNLAVYWVTGHTPWCLSLHPSWIRRWFSELIRTLSVDCLEIELIDSFMYPAFSLKALVFDLLLAISLPKKEIRVLLSTTCCVNTSVIRNTRRGHFSRTHELCHS